MKSMAIDLRVRTQLAKADLIFLGLFAERWLNENKFVSFATWLSEFSQAEQERRKHGGEPSMIELPVLAGKDLAIWLEALHVGCRFPIPEAAHILFENLSMRVLATVSALLQEIDDHIVVIPDGESDE